MKTYKLGVIGDPIEHSLSPKIHNIFARQANIKIDYQAYRVDPKDLDIFIKEFFKKGGDGLNITLPHKVSCLKSADELSDTVKKIGAANTLCYNKETEKIFAESTDGAGFIRDAIGKINLMNSTILILGAGGAAQSIIPAIQEQHAKQIILDNRSREKIEGIIKRFPPLSHDHLKPNTPLLDLKDFSSNNTDQAGTHTVINATSAGFDGPFHWDKEIYANEHTNFYDLSYSSDIAPTPFLKWADQYSSGQAYDGFGMLVNQAALSFKLWTDIGPDANITKNELFNE